MPGREASTFHKRAARYVKVSGAAAAAGARAIAGGFAGDGEQCRRRRAEILRKVLGDLKGPVMKIGQFLAVIPDLLPEEYAAELARTQTGAPPMGHAFVRRRMAAELGPGWREKFRSFEMDAAFAASLGQVHRAVGLDGTLLACKLQYPDMASAVEADIRQIGLALSLFSAIGGSIDTAQAKAELADRLREELDYSREAKHIALYRQMFGLEGKGRAPRAGGKGKGGRRKLPAPPLAVTEEDWLVHIPGVIEKLSTNRLLTMTWLGGEKLADVCEAGPQELRDSVAANIFRAWYMPFFRYGVIHGDPHPGNYTIRPGGGVNLMDFGCVRVFSPRLVEGVVRLYEALRGGDEALAAEAYRAWGFDNPCKRLIKTLNIWAGFVYAPFLRDRTMTIAETNTGVYGRETALRVYRELRGIGGISIPREFVLIDRASIGLGSVFLRLGAKLNWHRLFNCLICGFDAKEVGERQKKALKEAGLD